MFQNEADYLQEWIDYHRKVGVEHFWLYNNNSTDDFLTELQPYIDSGLVELIDWPSSQESDNAIKHFLAAQVGAFNDALQRSKKKSKWLAIIDLDEFIVPVSAPSITGVLNSKLFKNAPAIYVNWVMYGTSNVEFCPKGKLTANLLYRAETNFSRNEECKSIIRTKHAKRFVNPHYCDLFMGVHYVDGNGKAVHVLRRKGIHIDHLRVNHYWCRDRNFMNTVKIPLQLRWGNDAKNVIETEQLLNDVYDPIILQFLENDSSTPK